MTAVAAATVGRPVLVSGPAGHVVSLSEIKAHLRIEADEDAHDFELARRIEAAEVMLDGHGGRLGRCILSQSWAVEVSGAGACILPMPDVLQAEFDAGAGGVSLEVAASRAGPVVEIDAAGVVTFRCEMPVRLRQVAKSAVCFIVEREFDRPSGAHYDALTRTIDNLVAALRWRQV